MIKIDFLLIDHDLASGSGVKGPDPLGDLNIHLLFCFKFLFDCASSGNPEVKEVALHMFASVPGVFGNQGNGTRIPTY